MEIDIKKYENDCRGQNQLISGSVGRRICSNIMMNKNMAQINNGGTNIGTNKLVAGIDILLYLYDIPGYTRNTIANTDVLEYDGNLMCGNLMCIEIYRDWTFQVKGNEYFFFEETSDLPFMKVYQRQKKLERILKNEL
jgi:hypothetical protein